MGIIETVVGALMLIIGALAAGLKYTSHKNEVLKDTVKAKESENDSLKKTNTLQEARENIEEKHANDSVSDLDKRLHNDYRD